jgi:DNA-binding response OmpR family regulator
MADWQFPAERLLNATQHRILVVEDDEMVRKTVRQTCESEGYEVVTVERGGEAVQRAEEVKPDLILLDLVLPDQSGFDVCRELRRRGLRIPILILSAKGDEIDVVLGLEIGADDYIQKPFRPRELLARIASHLRKATESRTAGAGDTDGERLVFRDLVVDTQERRVIRPGGDVNLTHTEFDLLAYLARNAGQAISRETILINVWGYDHPIETRVIDVHIRNLRRKIEDEPGQPRYILAVPGVGYRFAALKPGDGG